MNHTQHNHSSPQQTLYHTLVPRPPMGTLDLKSSIPRGSAFELDIGFGLGLSLITRAYAAKSSHILGVEIRAKYAYQAMIKCQQLGLLHRVHIWAADIRDIIARAEKRPCFDKVSIHFPDPWWKKRHAKRILIQPAFLDDLGATMKDKAELLVQTDVESRYQYYLQTIGNHHDFEILHENISSNPFGSISNRERRAKADQIPIYRIHACLKKAADNPNLQNSNEI